MADSRRIQLTVTLGIAGILCIVAGLAAILVLTIADLRADLASMRQSLDALTAAGSSGAAPDGDGLTAQLARLSGRMETTGKQLSSLAGSLSALETGVRGIDARQSASVLRQQGFERWIITRLGPTPQPTSLPDGWYPPQVEIINTIKAGDEPLGSWQEHELGR